MTKVALAPFPVFYDNDGNPLSGGKVFTYDAGTLVNRATYTDRDGGTPNANPVILDSAGRADIWLDANVPYKIIVKNADESIVIADVDNFYGGADPAQLTLAGIVPATGGTYTGPVIFEGGTLFEGDDAENLATLNSLGIASLQNANLWINSDFANNQRGAASTADGAYGFDRTVALCDGGSVTLSQLAQPADGIPYAMRMLQPDAGPKRIGFCQIVEARNCLAYRGKQIVFAPKVRCSAAATVRVALVAWVGTLDAPTRDVVNNWASTNYTAGNFFVPNTLPIAVGAVAVGAGAWTDVPVSSTSAGGVVVPSNLNNLYMVVWTDGTLAQNATLDASVMRCGLGTKVPLWTPPDAQVELARCQRYLPSIFCPAGSEDVGWGGTTNTSSALIGVRFPVEARVAPTGAFSSGGFALTTMITSSTVTSLTYSTASAQMARMAVIGTGTPYVASQPAILLANTPNTRLYFTGCEL